MLRGWLPAMALLPLQASLAVQALALVLLQLRVLLPLLITDVGLAVKVMVVRGTIPKFPPNE